MADGDSTRAEGSARRALPHAISHQLAAAGRDSRSASVSASGCGSYATPRVARRSIRLAIRMSTMSIAEITHHMQIAWITNS